MDTHTIKSKITKSVSLRNGIIEDACKIFSRPSTDPKHPAPNRFPETIQALEARKNARIVRTSMLMLQECLSHLAVLEHFLEQESPQSQQRNNLLLYLEETEKHAHEFYRTAARLHSQKGVERQLEELKEAGVSYARFSNQVESRYETFCKNGIHAKEPRTKITKHDTVRKHAKNILKFAWESASEELAFALEISLELESMLKTTLRKNDKVINIGLVKQKSDSIAETTKLKMLELLENYHTWQKLRGPANHPPPDLSALHIK